MPPSRSQFNIRHLVELIAFCGFPFALVRSHATLAIFSLLACFPSLSFNPARGGTANSGGRMLYRGTVLVGIGIFYFVYCYFHPDPSEMWLGVAGLVVYFVFVTAPLWNRIYKAIVMGPGYQMPPTDDSCGPIVWQGFGNDKPEPRHRRLLRARDDA